MRLVRALSYAARAWAVFPLIPNTKRPLTENGFKSATVDVDQIRHWWTQHPEANIGVATGTKSGLVVVDVDVKNGAKGRESITQLRGLPHTLTAKTPSGGWHLYYSWTQPVGTLIGILPGIDFKAEGGYIVAPGSSIDSHSYEWLSDFECPVPLSAELVTLLKRTRQHATRPLSSEELILEGQRNWTLARMAGAMRRVGMNAEEITNALTLINSRRCRPPLAIREVEAIAASIARYPVGDGSKKR